MSINRITTWLALAVLIAGLAGKAHAGLIISMSPSSQFGSTGDFVAMDLRVSGLGDGVAPSLGDFDFDIGYDFTRLAVDGWTFGTALGDIGAGEAVDFSLGDLGGILALAELSFLTPAELVALQSDSFTLATISFEVLDLEPGEFTDVFIDFVWAVGDENGDPIAVDATRSGRIINQVPGPAAIFLMLPVLIVLVRRLQKG